MPDVALDYGDHRGRIELRETLASYLGRVRGVRVDPGRMVITQGFSQSLDLLCRTLAARGARRIAMESPSLPNLWLTVRSWGLELVGVPMDDDGPRLDILDRLAPDAFVVSPAHQYPSGQVMAAGAAIGARGLGATPRSADHRGRLRRGEPLRPDADRRPPGPRPRARHPCRDGVQGARAGTPDRLAEPARRARRPARRRPSTSPIPARRRSTSSRWPSSSRSGDHERQVARARHEYRARRDRLIEVLARELPGLEPRGVAAGVHLLLPLPDHADDEAIAAAAAEQSIRVVALSPCYLADADRGRRRRAACSSATPACRCTRIDEAASALAAVVRSMTEPSPRARAG